MGRQALARAQGGNRGRALASAPQGRDGLRGGSATMPWQYQQPEHGYLTESEFRQVEVLFDALHPDDSQRRIPGATQANAARYANLLLASGPEIYDLIPLWQKQYRQGLAALDAACKTLYNRPLTALGRVQATELLGLLESGKAPGDWPLAQPQFFSLLWRHCVQGCYGDPRWGGNRDRVMWRWYGYLQDPEEVDLGAL